MQRTSSFVEETRTNYRNQEASICNLEHQVGEISKLLVEKTKGSLPSNTETNPKDMKAITLRSGKELEKAQETGQQAPKENTSVSNDTNANSSPSSSIPKPSSNAIPFPQRLKKQNLDKEFSKFIDIFKNQEVPLILGRPFLATGRTLIDVHQGKLILRVQDEQVTFNVFEAMKFPSNIDSCFAISVLNRVVAETFHENFPISPLKNCILYGRTIGDDYENDEIVECVKSFDALSIHELPKNYKFRDIKAVQSEETQTKVEPPILELKQFPSHLRYAFLEDSCNFLVIINSSLSDLEEEKLLRVLREHRRAIGWTISDIKGISSLCMHKILMEESYKPIVQPQQRLNPSMQEVVKKEVVKLLDAGIIYPILDSAWVSPKQVVPKKGGMTVVKNNNNELIPTRMGTGWRVCIDYRRLNDATRKDHFPLPFIDQMVERLSGHDYYCFLDGYSGYNQIAIAPEDQEKTTFTCPYGIFAYRRMPFGLCNAPTTFQRCMISIFSDMVEKYIEVFMDDFSIFGYSFDNCLSNLSLILQRCVDTNLVLDWEKCHFMVREGIVLGHHIFEKGIEVDRAKIDVIEKLPPPTTVKVVRSFLGHVGFYRRFIKDFSKNF
ncbi:hypothetical protein UlMin_037668 [Ulmus minor]